MALAAEIIGLRSLGFSLAQVEGVLSGVADGLEAALAAHQERVECDLKQIGARLERIRALRRSLASGQTLARQDLTDLTPDRPVVCFELPWPWGGETFELSDVRAINYIVGPLGSGKTQLALLIANHLSDTEFLGLDRLDRIAEIREQLAQDAAARSHMDAALAWLIDDGAFMSDALFALVGSLYLNPTQKLVIDLIEQGLDEATQCALIAHLRVRPREDRPLFIMTRSSAILDLNALGPDETLTLCPANHSPPFRVGRLPGARGYEAAEICLGSPQVRARTEGMIAQMPVRAAG